MATPTFWKGFLKLSLVTCPVAMMPATTQAEKIRFHTLNRETGHRVRAQYVDSEIHAPVDDDDQVMGYARDGDSYVTFEDEELDAVALESTRTIDIETFVEDGSIGWLWYDTPHYLFPNDPVGEEAFAVIRDAMRATGTAGIARLVLYRRERAVLVKPDGKGMVVWTLRYGNEVRPADEAFAAIDPVKPEAAAMKLVQSLIAERSQPWSADLVKDPVQAELKKIIAAKKKGRARPAPPPPAEAPGNVIDIMDALKRSLKAEEGSGKRGK
ncbi:non-homologous end joining protein Ku [Roseixanthobacter liquoris]|uniref:non-homologous end joining protein Ku n=1 Tax=Roseixanthobacter liquoris TaxID=3119921 RepID=UPI00372AF1A2